MIAKSITNRLSDIEPNYNFIFIAGSVYVDFMLLKTNQFKTQHKLSEDYNNNNNNNHICKVL